MATRAHQPGQNRGDNPFARKAKTEEERLIRRAECMKMRLAGASFYEIGKAMNLSHTMARKDVMDAMAEYMREHQAETIPKLRAMELQRLDHGIAEVYRILKTKSGTELALKAVDRLARLVNLRADLLGLKVPIEVNLKTTEVTQLDLEYEELIRTAEQMGEATRLQIMEGSSDDGAAEVA